MIFGKQKLRIQPVPVRMAQCRVCNHITDCSYVDHDLRGYICLEDSAVVMAAELALRDARLSIPTDSILEDHS